MFFKNIHIHNPRIGRLARAFAGRMLNQCNLLYKLSHKLSNMVLCESELRQFSDVRDAKFLHLKAAF